MGLDSKHWLRKNADAGSEITCPVLLATECKYCHTPLNIYNGTPRGRLNRDLRATLPINELKGNPPIEGCPILNLHRCKTGHNVSKCSRLLAKKKADGTSATSAIAGTTIHVNVPANSSYAAALRSPIAISCSAKVENITVRLANPKQKKDVKHSWADDDYWASSDEE
jgi:hypothetical protein